MDNLFNDQVVPVTKYDIEKFKKDYSTDNCIAGEDLEYDSATNRYFTTSTEIYIKESNIFSQLVNSNGDYSIKEVDQPFRGCYIKGYDKEDNLFLTSKLLQENIDSRKLEISQSDFTGYYHRITFTGKPLKDKEILERRFYTGIDDGHREDIQDIYYNEPSRVGYYPVFHTDDILELRKKPSEKFIKYFFYSLFTTILLAVIACCTEFWLIYSGDHNKRTGKDREISIVIENSCTNIGKKHDNSNEKSYNCDILEQVFRWRIWNYPYQKCNDTIIESTTAATEPPATEPAATGGAKSRYDYHYNITEEPPENMKTDKGKLSKENHIDECKVEGAKTDFGHRPFPYNIGEKADELFNSELSRIIPRNVGYVILFIMLMYRYLVYHMFKNISNFYNESLRDLPIIKIIIFLASPILISLFINIVPILSTIGVLFFILFMIVQILQFFTDISNSGPSSPKMQSKEAFLVIIIFAILCYIVSIIISEIAFNTKYNTEKRDRCSFVDVSKPKILEELERKAEVFRVKGDKQALNRTRGFISEYQAMNETDYENQPNINAYLKEEVNRAERNIINSECPSEAAFNSNFKTCQTKIDNHFSINYNIMSGLFKDISFNVKKATTTIGELNGEMSGNTIFVEDYLEIIVREYIEKVKYDKKTISGLCYILLGCLGIFGIGTVWQKYRDYKESKNAQ